MPEISRFYGIVIYLYYDDHAPPHFHAVYGGREAIVGIEDAAFLRGSLPARAQKLVREWAVLHRAELREAWNRARCLETPGKINPLD